MLIAAKIGCGPQTLNDWVKKAEVDSGKRPGVSGEMAERMKVLERENRELWWANEILRKASAYFALAELDRRSKGWRSSLMTIVVRMGQGRFATFCQSPLPPITSIWPSVPIRRDCLTEPNAIRRFARRSSVCLMQTGRSTACARSGDNCSTRALTLLAALGPS